MFENLVSTLQLLLAFFSGLLPASDAGGLGAVGVAVVIVVAVAAVTIVLAVMTPAPGLASGAHPRRAMDLSSPLAQSDPDAAGHSRPRAPGQAVSAAH